MAVYNQILPFSYKIVLILKSIYIYGTLYEDKQKQWPISLNMAFQQKKETSYLLFSGTYKIVQFWYSYTKLID